MAAFNFCVTILGVYVHDQFVKKILVWPIIGWIYSSTSTVYKWHHKDDGSYFCSNLLRFHWEATTVFFFDRIWNILISFIQLVTCWGWSSSDGSFWTSASLSFFFENTLAAGFKHSRNVYRHRFSSLIVDSYGGSLIRWKSLECLRRFVSRKPLIEFGTYWYLSYNSSHIGGWSSSNGSF